MLTAFVLAGSHNARWYVSQPHGRFRFVDLLTASTARPILVFANVFFPIDVDLELVIDLGNNIDTRERCVASPGGVEGADADQPVIAGFATKVTVDIVAADEQSGIANTGLLGCGEMSTSST
jgi:hypothetical protein